MPYISQDQRDAVDTQINNLVKLSRLELTCPVNKRLGLVNYIVSRLTMGILQPSNYGEMASAIGTLECAKLEMYRRLIGPYEDKAIKKNGDIEEYLRNL